MFSTILGKFNIIIALFLPISGISKAFEKPNLLFVNSFSVPVNCSFRLGPVMCLGVTAGAYVLTLFAVSGFLCTSHNVRWHNISSRL